MSEQLVVDAQAEPLEQAEKKDPVQDGGSGAESAPAQEGETQKLDEGKDKPRLPAGVLKELAELREDRRVLRSLLNERTKSNEAEKPAPVKEPTKPNLADFETTEAYLDARDEWVREEARRVAREENQKAEQQREQRSEQEILADEWAERETAVKEKFPDYAELADAAYSAVETHLQSAIASGNQAVRAAMGAIAHTLPLLDRGPEVMYYLGQHPEEIEAMSKLHPTRVVAALGRIEARLATDNGGGDQKPPMPRAPKPVTPVRKASKTEDGELRDDLSPEEWRRRYAKKMERKE